MCARYTLKSSADVLQELFDLDEVPDFEPRFNIAPTQPVPGVVQDDEGKRHLKWFQWGLIPSWAKDPTIGQKLINARAETLAEKPAFRAALKRRRCLIPADGFYEWVEVPPLQLASLADPPPQRGEGLSGIGSRGAGERGSRGAGEHGRIGAGVKVIKQPYLVEMRGGMPFAFAGLWEYWETADGGPIESCAIVTTEPNELLKPIHNRMPVIVSRESYPLWLGREVQDFEKLLPILQPYPAEEMEAFPVSRAVNNPRYDSPDCVVPIAV